MQVSLARLIGFSLDMVLSMVFLACFWASLMRLRRKGPGQSVVVPFVLWSMLLLNTAQLCLQAADIYLAFIAHAQDEGGPSAYFLSYTSRILPARDAIFWTMSVVADILVIWRLYVIWLKNKYIVLPPVILLLCGIASGIVMFTCTVRRLVGDDLSLVPVVDKWWEITLGFTIALNLLTPALIIGRLWYIARQVGVLGFRSSWPYRKIASALMESGSLYTVTTTAWLIIFVSGSLPALWMTACVLPTIVAIVPTLIVLRINTPSEDPAAQLRHQAVSSPWASPAGVHISITEYRTGQIDDFISGPHADPSQGWSNKSSDKRSLPLDIEDEYSPEFPHPTTPPPCAEKHSV